MKFICITALMVFVSNFAHSQLLVRLGIVKPDIIGYGIFAEYVLSDSIITMINSSNEMTKEGIIKIWGLPLLDNGINIDKCDSNDLFHHRTFTLFKTKKSTLFIGKFNEYEVHLQFIKVTHLKLCRTKTVGEKWPEHNVEFEEAGLILKKPKVIKLNEYDQEFINKILDQFVSKFYIKRKYLGNGKPW